MPAAAAATWTSHCLGAGEIVLHSAASGIAGRVVVGRVVRHSAAASADHVAGADDGVCCACRHSVQRGCALIRILGLLDALPIHVAKLIEVSTIRYLKCKSHKMYLTMITKQ